MTKKIFAAIVALTMALAIVAVPSMSTVSATVDAPVAEAPVVEAPEIEAPEIVGTPTITNDAPAFHSHMWEMFGQCSNSFQVFCEGCGTFVSVPTDLTCEHQFVSKADKISGKCVTVCTKCKYNVQRNHSWDWAIDEFSHSESCLFCGIERNVEMHTFETVIDEDGHGKACTVCGYEVNAEEHDFVTEFDATSHWEYCVECGYQTAPVEHHLRNDFWGNTHEVVCDECWFTASHHAGVTWEDNGKDCTATCHCAANETLGHEWSGFECYNCEHVFSGPTGAVVKSISERDGYYHVRFEVNGERHYLDLAEVSFAEGDFVVINHNGNEIDSIEVLVKHGIVDDPEHIYEYAGKIIGEMFVFEEDVKLYDIVLKSHGFYEDSIEIEYDRLHVTSYFTEYEIYDLRTGKVAATLCNGDAVLYYIVGGVVYLLIVW